MQHHIYINETLHLTPFYTTDKSNLILYLNDPDITRNTLNIPVPYTPEDADHWTLLCQTKAATSGQDNWAIRHAEAGLIGGIGMFLRTGAEGHADEIGYWLAAPFRGRGWMTEVVRVFTAEMLASRPALVRIEAKVFTHNPASARVCEKAGFEREGILRKLHHKNGAYIDALMMAKIRF